MNAYKKEAWMTVGFFIAYLLMAHTAPWALIFGIDNSVRVLGFPLHYFLAIALGWFGVLAISVVWNRMADRLEDEILADTGEPETHEPATKPAAFKASLKEQSE